MRIGSNPAKADASLVKGYGRHRVVVPVYIPNQEDYFKQALEIALLSLESLFLTTRGQVAITVVSNGCIPEAVEELLRLHERGWIEQLVLDRENRGKVNAVLAIARGSYEPFITIADCDILYLPGWQQSIEQLFEHFPECGFASPLGMPKPNCRHSSATIVGAWLKRELVFEQIASLSDIERHATGMQKPSIYEMNRLGQLGVRRNGVTACVGCGHMIFTVRREALNFMRNDPAMKFARAEEDWVDKPVDVAGFWRLCPAKFTARTMGNTVKPWVLEEMEQMRKMSQGETGFASETSPSTSTAQTISKRHWSGLLPWRLRRTLARKIRQRYVAKDVVEYFNKLP